MKRFVKFLGVGGLALAAMSMSGYTYADLFTGEGDGTSWEDPANWLLDAVPQNNGIDDSGNTVIRADDQVVFDADTWAFLQANDAPDADPPVVFLQNDTEYRIARLLMGDENTADANGEHSLTLDQGEGNTIRVTNGNSAVFGGRVDKISTLNILSGITNIEANAVRIGAAGVGIVNLVDGEFICGRGGLQLGFGETDGTGSGTLTITGGSFRTRGVATIGPTGTFEVVGSQASEIGIGSQASVDGEWIQQVGGTLSIAFDAGGSTLIFVDDCR